MLVYWNVGILSTATIMLEGTNRSTHRVRVPSTAIQIPTLMSVLGCYALIKGSIVHRKNRIDEGK